MQYKKAIWMLAALCVSTLQACHVGHNHSEENHNHESHTHESHETHSEHEGHDHGAFQTTSYSNGYEIFSEINPFIAGEQASILAHITDTKNYKPLSKSYSVTMQLLDGQQVVVEKKLNTTTRPGIYRITFHVPSKVTSGKLQPVLIIQNGSQESTLTAQAHPVFTDHHEALEYVESHTAHTANAVPFTKEQSWKIPFRTDVIKDAPFYEIIKSVAQVKPYQSSEQTVTMQTAGSVSFNKKSLTNGMYVRKGQVLMTIQPQGIGADNLAVVYTQKQAEYTEAKANFTRKQQLVQEGLISQADFLAAQTTLRKTEAAFKSMETAHIQGSQKVIAPMSGYIKNLSMANGTFLQRGAALLTIAQNQYVYLEAQVAPKYYQRLKAFVGATFIDPDSAQSITLQELGGELVSYDQSLAANRALLSVTFKVKNTHNWIPGRFIDLYIQTSQNTTTSLSVPNEAIVETMGKYFLFIQVTPEIFEQRPVTLGGTNGRATTILSGLQSGERVVTNGAALIKLSQSTGKLDPHAGHSH